MGQNIPNRHYGRGFARFLMAWIFLGFLALTVIGACLIIGARDPEDPITSLGAIAIAVFGLVLYSVPSVIACGSEHPSRTGIYVTNWLLGWTALGWFAALLWALSGANARMVVIGGPAPAGTSQSSVGGLSAKDDRIIGVASWVLTLTIPALVFGAWWSRHHHIADFGRAIGVVQTQQEGKDESDVAASLDTGSTVADASDANQGAQQPGPEPTADIAPLSSTGTATPSTFARMRMEWDEDREAFRQRFPDTVSRNNLIWIPAAVVSTLDASRTSEFITPYGPCAFVTVNASGGFTIFEGDTNPQLKLDGFASIGEYTTRADAQQDAERFCRGWFQNEAADSNHADHSTALWFSPSNLDVMQPPAR